MFKPVEVCQFLLSASKLKLKLETIELRACQWSPGPTWQHGAVTAIRVTVVRVASEARSPACQRPGG
eukprot:3589646-Rhodomonas_salina.1